MKKVRVGVIGAGVWAQVSHLPTLLERADEIELVGVCRKGSTELRQVAHKFGFAVASEDYRDILDAGIDLCVVSSPVGFHHEHAVAALEAGAHVLLEKPVTLRPNEAWDIERRAHDVDRHVVVAYGWNYLPTFVLAKEALTSAGGLGEIEHVMVHMAGGVRELLSGTARYSSAGPTEEVVDTSTWTNPAISGGGVGQALLTHTLAWLLGITDLRAEEVFAFGSGPHGTPVELHDAMAVRFVGGASGALSASSFHSGSQSDRHQFEVRVFGSGGQLHADLERDRLWVWRSDGEEFSPQLPRDAGLYHCRGPVHAALDLAQGRSVVNQSPIELGARTVEVLAAAYDSMSSGQPVQVKI